MTINKTVRPGIDVIQIADYVGSINPCGEIPLSAPELCGVSGVSFARADYLHPTMAPVWLPHVQQMSLFDDNPGPAARMSAVTYDEALAGMKELARSDHMHIWTVSQARPQSIRDNPCAA